MPSTPASSVRAGVALLVGLAGCGSRPLVMGKGSCAVPGYAEVATLSVSHTPLVDLAFVVSNSPSMAVKREKLTTAFPTLIQSLRNPADGTLPNLRVAFLDGDMGTDSSHPGDGGKLQLVGGSSCGIVDPGTRWLQMATLTPANYTGDATDALTCLLGNLPQGGSAYQQVLRAAATSAGTRGPATLSSFVREKAYLSLVVVSDEDDCSTLAGGAMFTPSIATEGATLRCATRGHRCQGGNLGYPTTGAMTWALDGCQARSDPCEAGVDVTQPTACSPLVDVHTLAQQILALKSKPADMIVATGIFGWPLAGNPSQATYKMAPIPNTKISAGAPSTVYDLWPVCYDPDHPPSNPDPVTGYDAVAASYGAKPGLRMSAFVEEFGDNGLKLSACAGDWSSAMRIVGDVFPRAIKLVNRCLDANLVDTDPSTPEVEPDCIVDYFRPKIENPTTDRTWACPVTGESPEWTRARIPRCDAVSSGSPCWRVVTDFVQCPNGGLAVSILHAPETYRPDGTSVTFQCRQR